MIKKIYHGSKDIVKKPEYGKGKTYNDYGLGFYCIDTIEMAKEWGVDKTRDGYANEYEIAENSVWYTKKEARDKAARREYFDVERNKRQRGDIYITQIIDEEMKADDRRLR